MKIPRRVQLGIALILLIPLIWIGVGSLIKMMNRDSIAARIGESGVMSKADFLRTEDLRAKYSKHIPLEDSDLDEILALLQREPDNAGKGNLAYSLRFGSVSTVFKEATTTPTQRAKIVAVARRYFHLPDTPQQHLKTHILVVLSAFKDPALTEEALELVKSSNPDVQTVASHYLRVVQNNQLPN